MARVAAPTTAIVNFLNIIELLEAADTSRPLHEAAMAPRG
jgi:hypothetical protein